MRRTSRGKPVAIPGCALRTLCSHYLIQWDFYRQEGLFQMTLRVSPRDILRNLMFSRDGRGFPVCILGPTASTSLGLVGNTNSPGLLP